METLKTWMATGFVLLSFLLLCGLLDKQPAPEACITEVRDAYGNVHQISGSIAKVDVR